MSKPNLLILMLEHGHYGTLAPGGPVDLPNIAGLLEEGCWLESMYTVAAHSCPARASFFTGVYPSWHGIFNNVCNPTALRTGIHEGVKHFSEPLAGLGYELRLTGKWHISVEERPESKGWKGFGRVTSTEMSGRGTFDPGAGERALRHEKSLGELADAVTIRRDGWPTVLLSGAHSRPLEETAEYELGMDAIGQIEELSKGKAPWCIYCGWQAVHDPYRPPQSYAKRFAADEVDLPANFHDDLSDKPAVYRRQKRLWGQLSEAQVRQAIAHYRAWCKAMDDIIGMVLEALDRTGQRENTMVVLNTDHGDYLGAHGLWCKGIPCFEEAYHLPTAIRWPAGIGSKKRRIKSIGHIVDFAPTFLEAAGAQMYEPMSGQSLLPLLDGREKDGQRNEFYAQMNGVELYYTQRIMRVGRYKYVFNGFDFDELYDLEKDPGELKNRIDDPSLERVRRDLLGRLWEHVKREKDPVDNQYATVGLIPVGPFPEFRLK
jgi:arylsulfatase A-like enzyme